MQRKGTEIKKRMWALLICVCMAVGMLLTGCGGEKGTASGITDYTQAKNGVVVVSEYVALDGEEVGIAHGSGFFVGVEGENPQYLITNHHVIEDYLYYGAGERSSFMDEDGNVHSLKSYIRVYFDSTNYVEAYIEDYDETADIALLKLETPTDQRQALALCPPTEDMVGSQIYVTGFPGLSDNAIIDATTSWGLSDISITAGVINRLVTTSGTGVRRIQTDAVIQAGNSGGPMVNENGSVVGVNVMTVADSDGILETVYYAVNINEAIELLDFHNVSYTEETAPGISAGKVAVIAVLAILILAAAVILIVVKRKKKKAALDNQASIPPTGAAPSDPTDSGYRLQGVSGALEGRRFMIKTDSMLILGRNPELCNVTYPANTAGVSGKHCQVWCDHGKVYVKDLGSSHGTFLGPGKRVSSNQPIRLKPGDCFYLGSQDETMVLAQKGGK